ncbi:uncharacterized protein PHA67_013263 [Liasis olivaceus]
MPPPPPAAAVLIRTSVAAPARPIRLLQRWLRPAVAFEAGPPPPPLPLPPSRCLSGICKRRRGEKRLRAFASPPRAVVPMPGSAKDFRGWIAAGQIKVVAVHAQGYVDSSTSASWEVKRQQETRDRVLNGSLLSKEEEMAEATTQECVQLACVTNQ